MPIAYFDSSALVKLVVDEDGSELAATLYDGCDAAVSSRIAQPEVRAALAAARRAHRLTPAAEQHAVSSWRALWDAMRPVELTDVVADHAGRLAAAHSLRGADAVHLASALALADADVIFAAWDERLRRGADAAGLVLFPA